MDGGSNFIRIFVCLHHEIYILELIPKSCNYAVCITLGYEDGPKAYCSQQDGSPISRI